MNVLFNIQKFNNINVQNNSLLLILSTIMTFNLPNCINVDPNDLLINQLSATTCIRLSMNISSLKKHFQTLQTEITDNFQTSVIGLCETKIDSNIAHLYNLAGYNLITNDNVLLNLICPLPNYLSFFSKKREPYFIFTTCYSSFNMLNVLAIYSLVYSPFIHQCTRHLFTSVLAIYLPVYSPCDSIDYRR